MPLVRVGATELKISNLDKILFPQDGITKGQLIDYYLRISDRILPFLKGRPVSMERFPDGIDKEGFFQKDVPDYFPEWINRIRIEETEGVITYLTCDNVATLVYLADQACITPHVWLSRADRLNYPDRLIFDLDPPDGSHDFEPVRLAALLLRELLEEVGVSPFVMTTGSRGLHVVVPLDRSADFHSVRSFGAAIARTLERADPQQFTTEQRLSKRRGRVFIDVMRNRFGQTAAPPYAVRPKNGAPIAAPLDWDELRKKRTGPQSFNINNIFRKLARKPDPWAEIWRQAYSLSKPRGRLSK